MGKIFIGALVFFASIASAESNDNSVVRLYQIGKDGNYCLSISKDTSGCVSGENDAGKNINVLDFVRGKRVVFENLSDAPHDMKFSGANAQDLPVQAPGGADAQKQVGVVDLTAQKISCSFHGAQLGVGYRVPNASGSQIMEGHKETGIEGRPNFDPANAIGGENPSGGGGSRKIVRTGLADVSGEVLSKGRQSDVERLVSARPELLAKLQEIRPLLASEIAANAPGAKGAITPGAGNGSILDSNFGAGKNGESQGGAGSSGGKAGGAAGSGGSYASGKSGAEGTSGSDSVAGGGRKDVKRLLAAATAGEEASGARGAEGGSDHENSGWASSILGQPSDGENRAALNAIQSASLSPIGPQDRTKLKTIHKIGKGSEMHGILHSRWLLLALIIAIGVSGRWILFATKNKKEIADS